MRTVRAGMRAYFDAFSGISGDMTVGALLDLGAPFEALCAAVASIDLPDVSLFLEQREHDGIRAMKFVVRTAEPPGERTFATIRAMLARGTLTAPVRERALAAFSALAEAEGRIHGMAPDAVHFHEVGSADAIADVVGAAFACEALGITHIYVSPLPLGRGIVESQHGRLPVPAPATADLLRGFAVVPGDGEGEMVTPTGAAILRGFGAVSAVPPSFRPLRIGYGAGTRHLADRPNVLRVMLGEGEERTGWLTDSMLVVESAIDDMSPELFEHVMARLFAAGAADVVLVPVQMKKSRPGVMIQVVAPPALRDAVAAVLFAETTTIGLRFHAVDRLKLERRVEDVETPYGPIAVKIAGGDGGPSLIAPEYESCRAAAERHGVPLRLVYDAARRAAGG
jgi:pyridinium-3,5-bisthiocarboxylic acid mononucleotide nickel chelatase